MVEVLEQGAVPPFIGDICSIRNGGNPWQMIVLWILIMKIAPDGGQAHP
jgi:hypothetical protein